MIIDRFKNYKKLNNLILKNISTAKDKCLIHSQNKDYLYSFNNNIFIIKRIGYESSDGSIFLTEIKSESESYYFITKIQIFTDLTEMLFLDKVTKYAVKYKNIHLPLFYNYLQCNEFNKFDLLLPDSINVNRKINSYNYKSKNNTSYYSIFAELADGDMNKYTEEIFMSSNKLYNAIAQCFMAIISFHNIGIFHRDTHLGNFLYHKIDSGGCFEYKYKDLIFYIENIGYYWVIWDFGRSKEIKENHKFVIYEDLELLIESILEILFYDYKSNNSNSNKKGLKEILKIINKNKDDYLIIKQIFENNMLFSKVPIGKIIATINLK
jgi:hypothetical protein